jgi:hypothetical protein
MSIEIYVLSDRCLQSIAEWQQAIVAEGFNLTLDTGRSFEALGGHLPAQRGDQQAGFECDHWDPADILDTYDTIDFGRRWSKALAFRFGGDELELWGAYAAAASYARATGGVVFDGESGEVLSPDQAVHMARNCERDLPG